MKVRVFNIQRFCLHDGPGIRTTVFLKGCNLKCPWCANPEGMNFEKTEFKNKTTGQCGIFGKDYECEELYNEIIKDKEFYKLNNGGVTFSGGEPLLQINALEPMLKTLKSKNINICFETALHVPTNLVEIAAKYADEFIVDMKILNKDDCKKILNGDIDLYLKNLGYLSSLKKIYTIRIPLVYEYTLKKDNIDRILVALEKYEVNKVELFKIHSLAESKYLSINEKMNTYAEVKDEDVNILYEQIKKIKSNVKIIKI